MSVEIDIAHEHDAFNIEHDAPVFPTVVWGDGTPVPTNSHLLESSAAESALGIVGSIIFVDLLVLLRSYPWLRDLEIVGQMNHFHALVFQLIGVGHIASVKLPVARQGNGVAYGGLKRLEQ